MKIGEFRKLSSFDTETGEVVEGIPVWVGGKAKIHSGWFMTFQEALEELAKDKDLKGEHWRVFSYLMSQLDFENFIQIPQKQIAETLDMNKAKVSLAVKTLVDKKIIIRGPKVGHSSCFRLNPHYGWKGKVKGLRDAQKSHLKLVPDNSKASS